MRYDLPVGHPDFGRAFPCVCQQDATAEQRRSRLRRFSNMGALGEVTFASSDKRGPGSTAEAHARFAVAMNAAQEFALQPEGFLLLVGGAGTGKTHLAAATANAIMERGEPVFFAFVPELLDHLRAAYDPEREVSYEELFDLVKTVPMLILDDLGTQAGTPWAEEKLYQVLNHRSLNALPTVVTTSTAVDRLDARIQSRLLDPRTSRVIDLGGSTRVAGPTIGAVEPAMLTSMTFETFEPNGRAQDRQGRETLHAALTFARSYAEAPEGWLVLVGDPGTGKTHLAVAVANERLRRGEDVFFAFVPDLLDHLRYTFSPDSRVTYDELFDRVKHAPLLILDDLGSESSTAWANEKLYQVIVHRHNAHLPTIITTRAIPSGSGDPVSSRLNDPRLVVVMPLAAPDYRQPGSARKQGPQGR